MDSSWVSLTGECAEFVLRQLEEDKALCKHFSTAYAPDELVVPTIVFNSVYASRAIRCTILDFKGLTPLHYWNYTSHIWIYDEKDFNKIILSNKVFVRKLVSPKSDKLVEMIDRFRDSDRN